MHRLIIFFFTSLFFLQTYGQGARAGTLLIGTQENLSFKVYLNNELINDQPESEVRVEGLNGDIYELKLKLYLPGGIMRYLIKHVLIEDGMITFYEVLRRTDAGDYVIRLRSVEPVPLPPPPDPLPPNNSGGGTSNTQINVNVNIGGNQIPTDPHHDHSHDNVPPPPPLPDPVPGYTGPVGCDYPVTQNDVNNIIATLEDISFESTKLSTAKSILQSKCLLVQDLKKILSLFYFESNRLELAKFAYPYVYDQGNYYLLSSVFDFDSSVRDLNDYISRQR